MNTHHTQYPHHRRPGHLMTLILTFAALQFIFSCQTLDSQPEEDVPHRSRIMPLTGIIGMDGGTGGGSKAQTDGTRAVISGSSFTSTNTYGIFLCRHWDPASGTPNGYEEFSSGIKNIKAENYYSEWRYTYGGHTVPNIFLNANEDGTALDAFAYAPFKSGISSPESIPVLFEDRDDIMWAVENADEDSPNRNIVPDGSDKTVYLHFRHALSLLKIGIRLNDIPDEPSSESQYPSSLQSIGITTSATPGATPLYSRATFNAMTGDIYDQQAYEPGSTYKHYIKSGDTGSGQNTFLSLGKTESFVNILLIPTDYASDGDFVLSFRIDGTDMPLTYSIRRSDLMHTDGVTCGFQPGHIYTFHFVYDNYIHLEGVSVRSEWKENEPTEIII